MKRSNFLKKVANSFAGRVLRRLLGEEKGAVMMEYIVIGLLIAAVAVVAVGAFGGAITSVFGALTGYVVGESTAGDTSLANARTDASADLGNSDTHRGIVRNDAHYQNTATDVTGFDGK